MHTLHTVLNRGLSIWDSARIPEEEFRGRLDRVREGMREHSCDLLLVYGDSWKYGNLAYLTHFLPKNRGALAVIPMEGAPALIVQEPSRNNPFSKTLTWIQELHSVGSLSRGLGEAIKEKMLKPKKVGLVTVKEQLNIREWREMAKLLEGAELCDLSDFLSELRALKSPREAALIEEAARILAKALSLFEKEARPGMKEYEIFAHLDREARRLGAEDFRLLLARSSKPQVGLRPAGGSALEKGEGYLILVGASYQRYWAEVGRTFCLGSVAESTAKAYGQARLLFGRLREEVNKGVFACSWLSGLPSPAQNSLKAYGLGNGVGLDFAERPFLGDEIKPGMILTLRVCLQGKECGSALISTPFLVTSSGARALASLSEDLVSVGA